MRLFSHKVYTLFDIVFRLLPEPKTVEGIAGEVTRDPWFRGHEQSLTSHVELGIRALAVKEPPPYGLRQGFLPRKAEDFGDGGAFPEIHIAQYPLGMSFEMNGLLYPTFQAWVKKLVELEPIARRLLFNTIRMEN